MINGIELEKYLGGMQLPTIKNPWIWIMIIATAAIAATAVAVIQYRKAELLGISKFVEAEYEPVRNVMIIRWKKSRTLSDVTYDLNGDLHADSIVHYGSYGSVSFIERDVDFDGHIEELFIFNRKNQLVARQLDTDEDRYTNEMFEYFSDSIVHYVDGNEDGHLQINDRVGVEARTPENSTY